MYAQQHTPDPRHAEMLARGVQGWNRWRRENPEISPALSGIPLRGRRLRNVDFRSADLDHADLSNCDLTGADLRGANLAGANLNSANMNGVHLTGAVFWETCVINVNLAQATGLADSVHHGPSAFDHRTMWRSKALPAEFLRGCGVPRSLIESYRETLAEAPLEFNSCFICHSSCDLEFASRLHDDLKANGVNAWFAPNDSVTGRRIHEELFEAISGHDKFLIVLSDESLKSDYVGSELQKAAEIEKAENRQLLFPVRLTTATAIKDWRLFDEDLGLDIAKAVRSRVMQDFEKWEDEVEYQRSFVKLLRGLAQSA